MSNRTRLAAYRCALGATWMILLCAGCGSSQQVAPVPTAVATPEPPSGNLHDPRFAATATLLMTGKVLIAGGVAQEGAASTVAELYDPILGGFVTTAGMLSGRSYHTATILADGQVLFAGGLGKDGRPVRAAEIYNPASGQFEPVGNLIQARFDHTATLLPNGKVLITGGGTTSNGVNNLDTAELYDPGSATFTPTGNVARLYDPELDKFFYEGTMSAVRGKHSATLLAGGKVLITGGEDARAASSASAEIYDSTTGKFAATGSMQSARKAHRATILRDGRVLVTGGIDSGGQVLATAELYDPATGNFELTSAAFPKSGANMAAARGEHTATILLDGRVLIAGGGSMRTGADTAELYDPARGSFECVGDRILTPIASPAGTPAGACLASMNDYRDNAAAAALPDGTVLIAGGYNFVRSSAIRPLRTAAGASSVPFSLNDSAEIYDPATGHFTATLAR